MSPRPAILLAGSADVSRSLGRRGVPVILASPYLSLPGTRSKYVRAVRRAPAGLGDAFKRWFEDLLTEFPDAVVFANSDEPAWWLARYVGKRAGSPLVSSTASFEAIRTVLTKHEMYTAAREVGLVVPRWWLASGAQAVKDAAEAARFPVVLKPQCRVGNQHWLRGRLAQNPQELLNAYQWYGENVRFADWVGEDASGIADPLVQEYRSSRPWQVYHLAGYRAASGEHAVAAHLKLIQYPARFGNGACFSATEVEPELAERLAALLDHLGYRGIFEAEFVGPPGDRQLIDLNPRAYNGMALETVRGLDSAWCAYLEAIGDTEALSRELAAAHSLSSDERLTCRDNTVLWTIVIGRTLAGGFSPREGWRWARWAWRTRKTAIDPLFASGDRRPGFAYVGHHLVSMVRHPRRFMGTYVLQGPEH